MNLDVLEVFAVQVPGLISSPSQADGDGDWVTVQVEHTQELQGSKDLPSLSVNVFRPVWRRDANAPIEICVAALRFNSSMYMKNYFFRSYRLQLHTPKPNAPSTAPASPSSVLEPFRLQVKEVTFKTFTGKDSPITGTCTLSNAALMFSLNPKLEFKCFAALCDSPQPSPIKTEEDSSKSMEAITRCKYWRFSASIEPWSNAFCVGGDGTVAILRID